MIVTMTVVQKKKKILMTMAALYINTLKMVKVSANFPYSNQLAKE